MGVLISIKTYHMPRYVATVIRTFINDQVYLEKGMRVEFVSFSPPWMDNGKVTLRSINQSKGKRPFESWCTATRIAEHNIDLRYAKESVKQADLGIQGVVKGLKGR